MGAQGTNVRGRTEQKLRLLEDALRQEHVLLYRPNPCQKKLKRFITSVLFLVIALVGQEKLWKSPAQPHSVVHCPR
jgi:hypothetical protein